MSTILLLGKNGQIGWDLQHTLKPLGQVIACNKQECDLSQPDQLIAVINQAKPSLIVNAAAYTAVDQAEQEEAAAMAVNAIAPGILAEEAKKRHIPLLHYSTDYVFDGSLPRPYRENDIPCPLGVYGRSKLAGEEAIKSANGNYLIMRTSWVYSHRGRNFLKTMLALSKEKKELKVVNDQWGVPNWSRQLAAATAELIPFITPETADIVNMSSTGPTTWYEFALAIFSFQQLAPLVMPISTSEYPTQAKRPLYSVLDSSKLQKMHGIHLLDWKQTLNRFHADHPELFIHYSIK
jgi:dTDP-4-dehydrorhamnose reductase